jgi:hypothetical protein
VKRRHKDITLTIFEQSNEENEKTFSFHALVWRSYSEHDPQTPDDVDADWLVFDYYVAQSIHGIQKFQDR